MNQLLKQQKHSKQEEALFTLNDHWIIALKPIFILIVTWIAFYYIFQVQESLLSFSEAFHNLIMFTFFTFFVFIHHWFFSSHY